ncbi:MAG: ABC transporter ATP-binding protein [Burkholderiaceae bacterium]|jgi:branched-chain amino acid transport system ATP-binding protein|nr:ABC transporter ATP-binding protein [Burkholderiaceae bacterium]MCU0963625.1 ABC transporter ATP-binding protein [Burkholderiaceae bacterium]
MLEISDLHAWYGKAHVLDGVTLRVGEGEIVSLLGRNGVGRSTTVRAVMGHVRARGSVRLRGRELLGLAPYRIAQLGVGYVPESRDIFPRLTVRQNLMLGRKSRAAGGRWSAADFDRLFPILAERADNPAGVLSGGEQQILALCRTLMGDPELVMIDEPTEGLAPRVVQQVSDLLAEIARRGVAVLLVEQKLDIALQLSRRVYVMGHGQVVYEGEPRALVDDTALCTEWLGV